MDHDLSQFLDRPGVAGWVGGLMDEYARAAVDFCGVLEAVPPERFLEQRATSDPDCASIQNLCVHVVGAAHGYANLILRARELPVPETQVSAEIDSPSSVRPQLAVALKRTEAILHDILKLPQPEQEAITIRPRWGLPLMVDVLVEHAIVHMLRHRRQLERW